MRALLPALLAVTLSLQAQPGVQRFAFPNGLQLALLEDHEHPLVRARLHLRIEAADVPPGRQGLAQLALRMLDHSDAADLSAEDLARLQEDSGILLASSLEPDGFAWGLVARSRDQDRALGLLADRLLRTVFDPSILEVQRLACWREEEPPAAPPYLRLRQALAQAPGSRPSLASLGAITLEDLHTFQAKVFRPDRAILVLHGDLGLEQAKRLVLLSLGSWTAQEPPPSAGTPAPVPLKASSEAPVRIPTPGPRLRLQAVLGRPGDVSPETAELLGLLLPGHAALSPLRISRDGGLLLATLDAEAGETPGSSPLSLCRGRLEALRQRGFTQRDLDQARRAWLGSLCLDSLHPEAQLDLALAEIQGRGPSVDRMKAVSLDQLNAGLRSWLDPSTLRWGAAGDPEVLKILEQGLNQTLTPNRDARSR